MADALITPSELASALQQDVDTATATLLIELATGKVQAAAGQLLVDTTSTITLHVDLCEWGPWLALPQLPVRSVASVLIDGVATTDWYLRNQQLWRLNGWNTNASAPAEITVEHTHGYLAGAQALQLARGMTLGLAMAGYGNPGGSLGGEQIDDYRAPTYAEADARMVVTDSMRDQLVAAYGISAYVTSSR